MTEIGQWQEFVDASTGRMYYFNRVTQETSWTPPSDWTPQQDIGKTSNVVTMETTRLAAQMTTAVQDYKPQCPDCGSMDIDSPTGADDVVLRIECIKCGTVLDESPLVPEVIESCATKPMTHPSRPSVARTVPHFLVF